MATEWQYFCTANAYDPATLTRHMNQMARAGWELLTVTFAIKGEGGTHTLFWRRPASAATVARRVAGSQ
jgi:type IV secretory pathway VirJ component